MRALRATVLPVFLILAIIAWSAALSRFPVTSVDLGYFVDYGTFTYAGIFLVLALVNYVFGARQATKVVLVIAGLILILIVIAALPLENLVGGSEGADPTTLDAAEDSDGGGTLGLILLGLSVLVELVRAASIVGPATFLLASFLHVALFSWCRRPATKSVAAYLIAGAAAVFVDGVVYFPIEHGGSGLPWIEGMAYATAVNLVMIFALLPVYLAGTAVFRALETGSTRN